MRAAGALPVENSVVLKSARAPERSPLPGLQRAFASMKNSGRDIENTATVSAVACTRLTRLSHRPFPWAGQGLQPPVAPRASGGPRRASTTYTNAKVPSEHSWACDGTWATLRQSRPCVDRQVPSTHQSTPVLAMVPRRPTAYPVEDLRDAPWEPPWACDGTWTTTYASRALRGPPGPVNAPMEHPLLATGLG